MVRKVGLTDNSNNWLNDPQWVAKRRNEKNKNMTQWLNGRNERYKNMEKVITAAQLQKKNRENSNNSENDEMVFHSLDEVKRYYFPHRSNKDNREFIKKLLTIYDLLIFNETESPLQLTFEWNVNDDGSIEFTKFKGQTLKFKDILDLLEKISNTIRVYKEIYKGTKEQVLPPDEMIEYLENSEEENEQVRKKKQKDRNNPSIIDEMMKKVEFKAK